MSDTLRETIRDWTEIPRFDDLVAAVAVHDACLRADAFDEGAELAFKMAIMRQNLDDVKRRNPYRKVASEYQDEIPAVDYGELFLKHWVVGRDVDGRAYMIQHATGTRNGDVWRFSHVCKSPRTGYLRRIAPLLQIGHGHEVVSTDPLHIEPSILCDDCGTHGWVRDGRWVLA